MLADALSMLRMLVEINLFALVGQGVLGALPWVDRERNFFYTLLATVASPGVRFARWLAPGLREERRVLWIALFLLLGMWLALGAAKQVALGTAQGG
jgi:hypothetical protein